MGRPYLLLGYRMPSRSAAGGGAVWRSPKKAGAVYLRDSICVVPDTTALRAELDPALARIDESGGSYHLALAHLPAEEDEKLVQLFVDQTTKHYAEIVEDCEANFVKEIEFEHFRKNYTYEKAEEIRMEFEKICTWFDRVQERDWFDAPNQVEARDWLNRCETLLEEFEAKVLRCRVQRRRRGGRGTPSRLAGRRDGRVGVVIRRRATAVRKRRTL
jgi:hypothetical protein